ncbi:flagellar hook protein FlgE [Arenibaculum sp.]|jgi:flagellar hook protein FlgE|uniref:flagellar hook protein FlgE n=1 Tax=Arenibaculum sp. TaxID=2865862 RepID=UPI002E10F572|nr:flagellar hook protein FlgE [Arenibaculum sp.]
MSLFSAMRSGVSGLFAQSSRMAAISDNISNSGTVGYKRSDVDFSSMVTGQGGSGMYSAGGVRSNVHYQITGEAPVQGTGNATDLAITGRGFFVVSDQSRATAAGGAREFSLTRAGRFEPDDRGFLHNSAGHYLQGWKLNSDGTLPAVSREDFASLETVNVGGLGYRGSATTEVTFAANLPAQATAGSFDTQMTFYDGLGGPRELTFTWTPDGGVPNRWNLAVTGPAGYTVTPATVTGIDFHATGPLAGTPIAAIPDVAVTMGADTVAVRFQGMTQYEGDYVPSRMDKNGAKAGQVSAVEVDDGGKLWAIFDNGARQAIYQVPVADVVNPNGLVPRDGNTYLLGARSGAMTLRDAGSGPVGEIEGGALEQSNVDIAQELVSLIETQRAYSSSAKIVQTADEMMEETTRLKR